MRKIIITLEVEDGEVDNAIMEIDDLLDNSTIECIYNIVVEIEV